MPRYKILIAYDGSSYEGWQRQKRTTNTIQQKIEDALKKISPDQTHSILGSGRTDAGVHAVAQVCRVDLENKIPPQGLVKALNNFLPSTIVIKDAQIVSDDFHPIRDVVKKEYRYYFMIGQESKALYHRGITLIPYQIDFALARKACELFIGTKDFKNFQTLGSDPKTTIRTILSCGLHECEFSTPFNHQIKAHYFKFVGKGFLKQMVRLCSGAIFEVSKGKKTLTQLADALNGSQLQRIGPVAPANGLYLHSVVYSESD